jgi:hypothetical protein
MATKDGQLIKVSELKNGDLFSFRTIKKPIWWRFLEIKDGLIIYEAIKDKNYQFTSLRTWITVLKK